MDVPVVGSDGPRSARTGHPRPERTHITPPRRIVGVRPHLGVHAPPLAVGDWRSLMGPRSYCRNVLVIDDDDDARRFIHSRLVADPRTGMVWEASDPLTASALAEILPVDVVVLDFLLAQGTAVDCLPALR